MSYPLHLLRDIHTSTPPASQWWSHVWLWSAVAGLTLLVLLIWRLWPLLLAAFRLSRLWRLHRQADWIQRLNLWLKQTSLLLLPREQVAPLSGEAWLICLDQLGHSQWQRWGAQWSSWLYGGESVPDAICAQLHRQCWRWWRQLLWRRLCSR
ncbi:DUF4381 domain-containing protein [Pseudaeromonas sharmana]|uniref:DUF4381 domain-containing protein n=1 Tax=Pseudaeromonas sharmana TaxID=328412 RepID=A0ABV8CP79_9GAMM